MLKEIHLKRRPYLVLTTIPSQTLHLLQSPGFHLFEDGIALEEKPYGESADCYVPSLAPGLK
jgi:hypothetical protein